MGSGPEGEVHQRFVNKTVVVTGASSGIGAAAARQFAAEGANVVLVARNAETLAKVCDAIHNQDRTLAVPTDVTDLEGVTALLERAEQRFGAIHVLVNNAGFNSRGPVEHRPVGELTRVIDINLTAPVAISRLALPYLRRAGQGAIVNVASLAGRLPLADEAVYSASKFGLRVFSFALAQELRGSSIRVSTVSPGPVDTEFIRPHLDEIPDLVFSQPMSTAEDIATVILDCAHHGPLERPVPKLSGYLTTLGYLFPKLARALNPLMESLGRRAKRRYRDRHR